MHILRIQDLSVYFYIKDLFSDVDFVNTVDGFPTEDLTIPCIAVDNKDIDTIPWELGNKTRAKIRLWYIEVFAQNKSQRDDFSYKILDALENNIPVYNYDEGFPPAIATKIGSLIPIEFRLQIARIMPELAEKLYFRSSISLTATYDKL